VIKRYLNQVDHWSFTKQIMLLRNCDKVMRSDFAHVFNFN